MVSVCSHFGALLHSWWFGALLHFRFGVLLHCRVLSLLRGPVPFLGQMAGVSWRCRRYRYHCRHSHLCCCCYRRLTELRWNRRHHCWPRPQALGTGADPCFGCRDLLDYGAQDDGRC